MYLKEEKLIANEPQELLGTGPYWIVSRGNILLLTVVMGVLLLSFYIKYPETTVGYANIVTSQGYKVNAASHGGSIKSVLLKENAFVKAGECIIETDSVNYYSAATGHVHFLKNLTDGSVLVRNQNLFVILPYKPSYRANLLVNKLVAEKIALGQKVIIMLNNRKVFGYIDAIPFLPQQKGKFAEYEVHLTGEKLDPFLPREGPAEIVLRDMSLFSHIFQKRVD